MDETAPEPETVPELDLSPPEGGETKEEIPEAEEQKPSDEIEEESNKETDEPQEGETKEEIPEAEEQKPSDVFEEESNKETDEPQEGDITNPVTEEEAAPEQTSLKEAEEEPLAPVEESDIPDSGVSDEAALPKESHESTLELSKSKKSVAQLSLRSEKSLPKQPSQTSQPEAVSQGVSAPSIISKGKGKVTASSSIQTSLIWEFKPLADVLQDKSVTCHIEKGLKAAEENAPAVDTETKSEVVHEYYLSPQNLAEDSQGDAAPVTEEESPINISESKAQDQTSQHSVPEAEEDNQLPGQVSQEGSQQLMDLPEDPNKIPSLLQLTSEVRREEKNVWVSPKTGKEVTCSSNQTSLVWEKKPLADILRASRAMGEGVSWESGNGGVSTISKRIHIPYNPDEPEWAGYPNPFEY